MKKIRTLAYFLFSVSFISGCSQVSQRSISHSKKIDSKSMQPDVKQSTQNYEQQPADKTAKHSRQQITPAQQSPSKTLYPTRNLMVRIAKSAIGTPYKWGGDNPQRGFDCSGLMTYVHKNALGIKIPRTAAKQRDHSRTISHAQLQLGDMLFFKTGRKSNHVGIYVGNRQFVHAPSSGKRVKVSTMDSPYWHRRFVKFGSFL